MTRVLVLDVSYQPLNVTTVRRAVILVLKEKAVVVEDGDGFLRAEVVTIARPTVIRLVAYVRVPRTYRDVTRRAVLARDGWSCAYCGSSSTLTIDHVVPRSRGGMHEWTNVVTACSPCNHRKGDRLPHEVGMKLSRTPRAPTRMVFVRIAVRKIPDAWKQYLFAS